MLSHSSRVWFFVDEEDRVLLFILQEQASSWLGYLLVFEVSTHLFFPFGCSVVSDSLWPHAHQAPLFTGFPRQEYWSGLPFPPPRDLPDPGTEPRSPAPPALAGRSFTTLPPGKPHSAATGLPSLYLPTLERSPPLDKPSQLTQSQQSAFSFKWPTPLSRKTHTSYLYLTVFVHRYNWILKYCQIFE